MAPRALQGRWSPEVHPETTAAMWDGGESKRLARLAQTSQSWADSALGAIKNGWSEVAE